MISEAGLALPASPPQLTFGLFQSWDNFLQILVHGSYRTLRASLGAQMGKNLPATQETLVRSLAWEDSLKKGMATHSSILAWEIPWTGEPHRLPSLGSPRVGIDLATKQQQTC